MVQVNYLVKAADNTRFGDFLPEFKRNVVVFADGMSFDCFVIFALLWVAKYAHSFSLVVRALAAHFTRYYGCCIALVTIRAVALGDDYSFAVASFADSQNFCFSRSLHAQEHFSAVFKERDRAACR